MKPQDLKTSRKAKATPASNDRKVKKVKKAKPLCHCNLCNGKTKRCKRKSPVERMICLCQSCNGGNWQCRRKSPLVPTATDFDLTGLTSEERGIVFLYAIGRDVSDYFVQRNFGMPNESKNMINSLLDESESAGIGKAARARRLAK